MSSLTHFDFDGAAVRVVARGDEPWFLASDVCRVLGLGNNRQAIAPLDEDEKGVTIGDTLGGKQKVSIISESGLYAMIFKSRKPEAKAFRKWVTSVVLPEIRKKGSYGVPVWVDEERVGLVERLVDTQRKLGYALMMSTAGSMPTAQAKAVAAIAGRQMEAIRLHLELIGTTTRVDAGEARLEGGEA